MDVYDSMPSAVTIPAVGIPSSQSWLEASGRGELAVHVHLGGAVTRTSTRAGALAELQEMLRAELQGEWARAELG